MQKQREGQAHRARELREKAVSEQAAKARGQNRAEVTSADHEGSSPDKPKTEHKKEIEVRKQPAQREQDTSLSL